MTQQRAHWEAMYASEPHTRRPPSDFAAIVRPLVPAGARLLELGCGFGADAAEFAKEGTSVIAADFAPSAIAEGRQRSEAIANLAFLLMATDRPYPFADQSFDAVYAHLSLHYFTAPATRRVFDEIHRVLVRGGLLAFACKTTDDPLCGLGREIEPEMFELHGHVRHFFSDAFARSLLAGRFTIDRIDQQRVRSANRDAATIRVIARVI